MTQFQVLFVTEAADLEAAEAAVSEWVVTPDTTLHSIVGQVQSVGLPMPVEEGGPVGDIIAPEEAAAPKRTEGDNDSD